MAGKLDISNLSLREYLGIPADLIVDKPDWMFDFRDHDFFFQFLLKDNFKNRTFSLFDLEYEFTDIYMGLGNIDFEAKEWEIRIIRFISIAPPLIKQRFDEDSKRIVLELTDEAFKI